MKKLLNETIIYGIGAILPKIMTFLLNPFYIHFIEKEDFAVFTNLYAWIAFVNIILTFGFETSFFRFSAEKGNEKNVFNTCFWFLFGTASVFLIAVLVFNQPIANWLEYAEHPEYIRWFAWIAFLDTACVIPFAWLRFGGMPIKYSAIRVGSILAQTLAVITLFIYIPERFSKAFGLKEKVAFPFYSNVIGSLTAFILLLPVVLKVQFKFSVDLFKKMFRYSFPIMLAGLAFMVNENFDKLIQFYKIPKGDAGAYGGCYKLAVLMTLFVTAYRMGVEPFFFKQMNDKNAPKTYAKVTEFFTSFAAIAAMGIIANIDWLKKLFITDQSYWSAIDIVPIITIANLCFGIYYNFSMWYKVMDKTSVGTAISWSGAIVTIALNLLLLESYGFMVSAWVTLIAYLVMMLLSYYLGQKYYPIPYRIKSIFSTLLLLSFFSFLSSFVFNYNVWAGNLLLLIFIGYILFLEKNTLTKYLSKA